MEVGFTGTREGMTLAQKEVVRDLLLIKKATRGHHGDCVGADADFHAICRSISIPVRGHPPTKKDYRAFCDFDEVAPEKGYYARNRDIVMETELLIATPKEDREQSKGGTWYTVGYADGMRSSPIIIVWPNGNVETRGGIK